MVSLALRLDTEKVVLEKGLEEVHVLSLTLYLFVLKVNLNKIEAATEFAVDGKQDPAVVTQKDSVGSFVDLVEECLFSKGIGLL